jgi:hypothetical protein
MHGDGERVICRTAIIDVGPTGGQRPVSCRSAPDARLECPGTRDTTGTLTQNSNVVGNVLETDAEQLYFREASQAHRKEILEKQCPTCLSPYQMNVLAVKQAAPYVEFLVRAMNEKRRGRRPSSRRRG